MVSKVASKLGRARYIFTRLRESPLKFLWLKARIELRKKTHRHPVLKAARGGARFSGGFENGLAHARALGSSLRTDIVGQVRLLGHTDQDLLATLAEDFDSGKWRCLGFGSYALRPGHWAQDDFHNYTWPRDYFADINYVLEDTYCDTKVPWEKSRMQWLCGAALACCFDSDEAARDKRLHTAVSLFDDWVAENPYCVGVNWVSSMEVAIRAVNLLMAFSLLEDRLEEATLKRMLVCAGEHLRYLRSFPETSDVQGKHYLATALGEYFLEEFRGASGEAHARNFVAACLEQFSSEGLHIEFSPTYHRLSLDMVALGYALMKRQQPVVAKELEPLLAQGVAVCSTLANHGGELPVLSDNDSGMVLNFYQPARRFGAYGWLPLEGAQSVAALRQSATLPESIFGAFLVGLSGCAAAETEAAEAADLHSQSHTTAALLPPFAVLENNQSKVVVRAGALGLAGRASHDHDDALSFWYSIGGKDFIVEAGCPPYTLDKKERRYAIASSSHNLLTAHGQERFAGAVGSVTLTLRGGPEGRVLVSGQDGAVSLETELVAGTAGVAIANPKQHQRTLSYSKSGALCIHDRATFVDATSYDLRFHLAPSIAREDIRILPSQQVEVTFGSQQLMFDWSGGEVECVSAEPYNCHLDYGACAPATCLIVRGPIAGDLSLATEISVSTKGGQQVC